MENLPPHQLLKTPIHAWHMQNGAKMADFGGWEMPIEYSSYQDITGEKGGVLAEHLAVRTTVGLFDVSHLGKIEVSGAGAMDFLNTQLTNDLSKLVDGQAQYNLLCNEAGGVIDDLIVYRRSADDALLIPNASNCSQVFDVINANAKELSVLNAHKNYAVFALQGPNTDQVLKELDIKLNLEYMSFTQIKLPANTGLGEIIVCRTGYTGEFGYEFLPSWQVGEEFWKLLVSAVYKAEGRVCGLGARDTLRTEMGYSLHGHELSTEISPLQASSGWAVSLNKGKFLGSAALIAEKSEGVKRVLRGLKVLDRAIPRPGMIVQSPDGKNCGEITSGTFSPTLKHGVALALLNPSLKIGDTVKIDVRGRVSEAEIVKPPFVQSRVR
jgi:aminomethyltransferase